MEKSPKLGPPEAGSAVTAVIPVYNNAGTILPLLDSIAGQTIVPEEVVVVDDASTDNTGDLAAAHSLGVRVVRLERNSGPSVARNAGVEAAANEIVFFLDSDIVLDSKAVEEVKQVFHDPDVSVLNGMMKDRPLNTGWTVWYKCLVEHAWGDFVPQWDRSSTCLNTRIGAIRKSAFRKAGGFDPKYKKPAVEDHEFGQRLSRNYDIIFDKNLQAYHHFSNFKQTARNYWKRTRELLEMLWNTPGGSTDKGGASVGSAIEFIFGAIWLVSLPLLFTLLWFIPIFLLVVFSFVSYKSLKYCLNRKGILFYLFSLCLHAVYGFIVTSAAFLAFVRYKLRSVFVRV